MLDCAGVLVSKDIGFNHFHSGCFQHIPLDLALSSRNITISNPHYSVKSVFSNIKLMLVIF